MPVFNRAARRYLLDAGRQDWGAINPDIFGSMIQAIVNEDERAEGGLHYTSVPNIMKVLGPLFLDDLREELAAAFDGCLVAVDEFHHVSSNEDNRLGECLRGLLARDKAHLVAMTGSYFRGDTEPVLPPDDEERFEVVTYTYYEQLNGYQHLKTLGIGFHFHEGRYLDALGAVLDPDLKTIIHIPNVNSYASTQNKYEEVNAILTLVACDKAVTPIALRVAFIRKISPLQRAVESQLGLMFW